MALPLSCPKATCYFLLKNDCVSEFNPSSWFPLGKGRKPEKTETAQGVPSKIHRSRRLQIGIKRTVGTELGDARGLSGGAKPQFAPPLPMTAGSLGEEGFALLGLYSVGVYFSTPRPSKFRVGSTDSYYGQ